MTKRKHPDDLLVVGVGGTLRPDSSTQAALEVALEAAAADGATIERFTGARLAGLPIYSPSERSRSDAALELVETVRVADGLIIASPGYHASLSGMVKNALDYLEDLRDDQRPYLSRRSVGCIATGAGWQATVSTLASLRAIVHALRGWPTPLGAAINTAPIAGNGYEATEKDLGQLRTVGAEVVEFAAMQRRATA